ncbi:MAG: glycosyltransferase [Candidatus Micrarchaeota archaeon]
MKVLAIVESIGFGHAMRTLQVLRQFEKNRWETSAVASNQAAGFFTKNSIKVKDIPLSIELKETEGRVDVNKTIENIKMSNVTAIARIGKYLEEERPDLVIVDTSVIGMMAASVYKNIRKTPLIFIGTDNKMGTVQRQTVEQGARMIDKFVQGTADAYLVPDLPPPYAISEHNLAVNEQMRFIGPLTWSVNCKIPTKTAGIFLTEGKSGIGAEFPMPSGAITATEKDYEKKFLSSEVVIHHGGHTTAMDCILAEKPQVIIPIAGYKERINNGRKVEELGLGKMLLDRWLDSKTLAYAMEEAKTMKPALKRFAKYARSYRAAESVYATGKKLTEQG